MRSFISKLKRAFSLASPRERYLSDAVDLADLEFRSRNWDKMELERDRYSRFHTWP